MGKSESDYYLARVCAERQAAERATSEQARRAHLQLAEQYQQVLALERSDDSPREE